MRTLGIIALQLIPTFHLLAGGSFRTDTELAPILEQAPEIRRLIMDTFDLAESGHANRIGQNVNSRFGGRRLGPYILKAKCKGSDAPFDLQLIIHTEYIFKNDLGEPCDLPDASSVSESFRSIEIRTLDNVYCETR